MSKSICDLPSQRIDTAKVSLVTSVSIASLKGCCLKVKVCGHGDCGDVFCLRLGVISFGSFGCAGICVAG